MATAYRGMQCAPYASGQDIRDLVSIKANIIRYQITAGPNEFLSTTPTEYTAWVLDHLNHLDLTVIPALQEKAKIIIDLHTPPYGMTGSWHNIFIDRPEGQDLIVDIWGYIANRYKDNSNIYGFDILNEPAGSAPKVKAFMNRAVQAIRAVTSTKRVLVSCPRSNPSNFSKTPYQAGDKYCQYVLHMYSPMAFTHQGVNGYYTGVKYPTSRYNKEWLLRTLEPVFYFQKKNKARINMNEFSVSSFADDESRTAYIRDVLSIAQKQGWQWCYHAWREHPVWSAEDCPPVFNVLKRHFKKNRR